jgi:signal transduction histidine kinase
MRIGWPRSLTARILMMELVILGGAIVIVPPLTISVLHGSVARYQDSVLQTQARAVAEALRPVLGGGLRAQLSPALQPIFATGYDGRAYMVVDGTGRLLSKSLYGSKALAASAPRRDQATGFHTRDFVGTSVPVRLGGMALWVIVTQDQDQPGVIIDDVVREFLLRYLAVLLPLLVLLPIANSLIIRQLVFVVRRVSARAASIDAHNLDIRLPASGLPTEISPLVGAANGLIERLQASFQHQKEFSGNVAHELRTPLATLQLSLDAIEDRAVRDPLIRQVTRLSHVISQLRDLASLETFSQADMTPLDLKELAVETVAAIAPVIVASGYRIALDGTGPVTIRGNATLIGLALTNLLDNAMRHTPAGSSITVAVAADGSVSVSDDGPGVLTEDLDLLVKRFWRMGEERSDSAGIGLSIVQQIVDVHGGSLQASNLQPHGACFRMCLARAS